MDDSVRISDTIADVLTVIVGLCALAVLAKGKTDSSIMNLELGVLLAVASGALSRLCGKCSVKEDGIEIKKMFGGRKLVPYSEIQNVLLDERHGNSPTKKVQVVYLMTLVTQNGKIALTYKDKHLFRKLTDVSSQSREMLLMGSPFRPIENRIKERIGMGTGYDQTYFSW